MAKETTKKRTRPRARPTSAPLTSLRPRARPVDLTPEAERGDAVAPKKMAKGGMCRGMGAATRGGKYKAM
jgi:hypothetical protein